jgi:hypothetical protein
VDGEWRIDKLTPLDSSVSIRAQAYDSVDSVEESILSGSGGTSWWEMADNGQRIVRVSLVSPYIQYSDDRGGTWTDAASGAAPAMSVAWNGIRFVAVSNGSTSKYSVDGSNWTDGGALPASGNWKVIHTGTTFFAAMYGGNGATSVDGVAWAARTMAASVKNWYLLEWNGTQLLAVEYNTTYAATSDATGVTWTPQTLADAKQWMALSWGNDLWVLIANGDTTYDTSPDGAAWTSRTLPNALAYPTMAFNGNLFLILADDKRVYSATGTSWTEVAGALPHGYCILPVDGTFLSSRDLGVPYLYTHPGHTELGIVTDAQAITTRKRYYAFTPILTPDTTGSWTPTLRSVQAYFPTWVVFSTTPEKGYEPAIKSVSSLQTSIDTFKPATVGQMSLGLALTKNVSTWLKTAYPRNKEVRIYAGFTDIAEADYISYYRGNVEDWSIDDKYVVSIPIQNFNKTWKGVPVPGTWQDAGDDKTWTDTHHIDVMLDILQGNIGAPTKSLESSSFGSVKTALSGWKVTNTLTGKTFDAADLLEELRFVTGTYFIPQYDGRIKLKRWDKDEASVMALTDVEMFNVKYKGNSASLMNLLNWYFNMTTEGVAKSGGIALHQEQDGASQFNNAEKKTFEFKDYWTLTDEEVAQVYPVAGAVLERYAAIPDRFEFDLDLRFIDLELADMINMTTRKAPSTDLAGITAVKYQIVKKNLDFQKSSIKLEVLRAA